MSKLDELLDRLPEGPMKWAIEQQEDEFALECLESRRPPSENQEEGLSARARVDSVCLVQRAGARFRIGFAVVLNAARLSRWRCLPGFGGFSRGINRPIVA